MPDQPADELGRPIADHAEILRTLVDQEVDFLLIGGMAVISYGYVRLTVDVDILPSPREANMKRLATGLQKLDAAAVDQSGNALPLDLSHPEGLALGNYFLITKFGGLDLVNGARPDLKRYLRLERAASELKVLGFPLKVISKSDLIAMKREAGREKDLRDIAALTEVERNP
jgi:hypothetical protein